MVSIRQHLLLQDLEEGRLGKELEFRKGRESAGIARSCFGAGIASRGKFDEEFEDSIDVQQDVLATLKRLSGVI